MSIDLVAAALWLPLEPRRKLVLVSLCENADEVGYCWPSQDYIAARCSLSSRWVIPHLRALEADGWLSVVVKGRRGQPTERRLAVERILQEGWERAESFRATRKKGDESSRQVGRLKGDVDDKKGDVDANRVTLASLEPSLRTVIKGNRQSGRGHIDFLAERYDRLRGKERP